MGMTPDISLKDLDINQPDSLPPLSNAQWFTSLYKLFPGEAHLANESNRTNWNPICNSGDERRYKAQNQLGIGRYQSTNRFLTEVLEEREHIQLAYKRAHIDVWIAFMACFLKLNNETEPENEEEELEHLFMPVTGGRLLFTGKDCHAQTGHNDFFLREHHQISDCFCILTGQEEVSLWVTDHSHTFIFYPEKTKKELIERLRMKRVTIPGNSVFFGHGYLHHAGDKYLGSHCLRYHTYFRPEKVEIPNAVMFNHGGGKGPKYNEDGTLETAVAVRVPREPNTGATADTATNNEAGTPLVGTPNRKRLPQRNEEDDEEEDSEDGDEDRDDDPDYNEETTIVPGSIPEE